MNSSKGSSGNSSASLNSSATISEELMTTMDTLMQSLSSGDFSHLDPNQFYSLLDTLQGLDGLNPTDLHQLEHSYSQYLKVAASLSSSGMDSLSSNSGGISIPNNNRPSHMTQAMSPHVSPRISPANSPLSRSPQLCDNNFQNQLGSGSMSLGLMVNNPYAGSPNMSPNNSPIGSPVMRQNALLSSGSLTSSSGIGHLAPNRVQVMSVSHSYTSQLSGYSTSPVSSERQFLQDPTTEQQYLRAAPTANLLADDDEDEFDWSSIL